MAAWIKEEDVNERLKALIGKGWDEEDITTRIERATTFLKTIFTALYPASTITGWDSSCPESVKVICADYSAMILKEDFFSDYTPTAREKSLLKFLDKLKEGNFDLMDDSGNIIPRQYNRIVMSTANKTPVFSMGNTGDGTWGDGSLDDYGVDIYNQVNEVSD